MPQPAKFYVKSLVLDTDHLLTPDLSTKLFNYIEEEWPALSLAFILSDLQGGRTNDKELVAGSAYPHRTGLLFFRKALLLLAVS